MPDGYNTISGDTWDGISHKALGSAEHVGEFIAVNPEYASMVIFPAGVTLKMPTLSGSEPSDNLPPWRRGV